jgi:hypothetical protein
MNAFVRFHNWAPILKIHFAIRFDLKDVFGPEARLTQSHHKHAHSGGDLSFSLTIVQKKLRTFSKDFKAIGRTRTYAIAPSRISSNIPTN